MTHIYVLTSYYMEHQIVYINPVGGLSLRGT